MKVHCKICVTSSSTAPEQIQIILVAPKSPPTKVVLVPWDPDSPAHLERMVQQRISCGWHSETVPKWRELQRTGKQNLQWIVIDKSVPEHDAYLAKYTTSYPNESKELVDSATSLGAKVRTPNKNLHFIPVGHISLNTEYEGVDTDQIPGTYYITTFYVSAVLQSSGIGRAAMDIVEKTAISEPLLARRLALSTASKNDPERLARHVAHGMEMPKVTSQEWYERRGYVVYKNVERMWESNDLVGKKWYVPGVFMRKDIGPA